MPSSLNHIRVLIIKRINNNLLCSIFLSKFIDAINLEATNSVEKIKYSWYPPNKYLSYVIKINENIVINIIFCDLSFTAFKIEKIEIT